MKSSLILETFVKQKEIEEIEYLNKILALFASVKMLASYTAFFTASFE